MNSLTGSIDDGTRNFHFLFGRDKEIFDVYFLSIRSEAQEVCLIQLTS